jgi:hypothetical protein
MDTQKSPDLYVLPIVPIPSLPLSRSLFLLSFLQLTFHQDLRQNDRCPNNLLRNIHALRPRRVAQELPSLRMPFH